jgi:hypothetical protein
MRFHILGDSYGIVRFVIVKFMDNKIFDSLDFRKVPNFINLRVPDLFAQYH